MVDEAYVERLERIIQQMLQPLRNIPFNLVIKALSGCEVIPFDPNDEYDVRLLGKLRQIAHIAGRRMNRAGIRARRPNEVGNYIEPHIRKAFDELGIEANIPETQRGRKKAAGYPDIIFYFEGRPNYLECKTYNARNIKTTQRSFYLSPPAKREDFKVSYDAHHFLLSYEAVRVAPQDEQGMATYKFSNWKLLALDNLLLDVKYEFNSDNARLYGLEGGARLLAEEALDMRG